MMSYKMKFNLKKLTSEYDISLRELARLSGIEAAIINKMANNKRNSVYIEHLERIADALDIDDINKIIYFEKDNNNDE